MNAGLHAAPDRNSKDGTLPSRETPCSSQAVAGRDGDRTRGQEKMAKDDERSVS